MPHKFAVGETVDLTPLKLRAAVAGTYEIRRVMSETDANQNDPTYRIKHNDEKHERVVAESELTPLAQDAFALSSAEETTALTAGSLDPMPRPRNTVVPDPRFSQPKPEL
jgi:hypothetical protein